MGRNCHAPFLRNNPYTNVRPKGRRTTDTIVSYSLLPLDIHCEEVLRADNKTPKHIFLVYLTLKYSYCRY